MAIKTHLPFFGRGFSLRLAITLTCEFAFMLFGYEQGVFGNIVGNENFLNTFGHPGNGLLGLIVSMYNLGCVFGCFFPFLFKGWGRRPTLWLAMLIILIGIILQTSAYSVPHILIARFITGLGTGLETSTVPAYQAELCDPEKRGRLVSSEPLFVGLGIQVAYWFDYGLGHVNTSLGWRLPIAIQIVPPIVISILVLGLPESPRFLYTQGRNEDALAVMCDVYGTTPENPKIVKESSEILETIRIHEERGEYRWTELFKKDEFQTGRRVLLSYGLMFVQQLSGVNLIVYYITTVLENNVGLTSNLAQILGGLINLAFALGMIVPALFLDQMGRRKPVMVGSAICSFSMMMITILLSFDKGGALTHATSTASVAFFFLFMFAFGACTNSIAWAYLPEIVPLHARAKGSGVGASSGFLWNFFVVQITPTLINNIKWKSYIIFTLTNALFVPLIYFYYPETANLPLEEIDWLFLDENPVKYSLHVQKHGWGDRHRPRETALESAQGASANPNEKSLEEREE